MGTPTHFLDGAALDDPRGRWWILDNSALFASGAMAVTSFDYIGHHGSVPGGPPRIRPATYTLTVRFTGDSFAELQRNKDEFKRRFSFGTTVMELVVHPNGVEDANSRIMWVQRAGDVQPSRITSSGFYEDLTFKFNIPNGRQWDNYNTATPIVHPGGGNYTSTQPGTTGLRVTVDALADATAPMEPMFKIDGRGVMQVQCFDMQSGGYWTIAQTIAQGSYLIVDPANGIMIDPAGNTTWAGLTYGGGAWSMSPGARLHINSSLATTITVIGRRAYW